MPIVDPSIVRTADPVRAPFDGRATLPFTSITEKPAVMLDTPRPAVNATRELCTAPAPARTTRAVSDLQADISHPDLPSLDPNVDPASPRLDPSRLTKFDPVAAVFLRLAPLSPPTCVEAALVMLPALSPTLITTRRVPDRLAAHKQTVPLSDTQRVTSHAVIPARPPAVNDLRPMLPPCTVTLADPVDPAFPALNALIRPSATDTPRDKLPTTLPDVIVARRLPCSASPVLHRTDVSESHTDRSQLVPLTPVATDPSSSPSPAPCTVIVIAPVASALLRLTTLP